MLARPNKNQAEWIKRHFEVLSSTTMPEYTAEHEYPTYPKSDPRWRNLTQNVNIAHGWLLTDNNVEIFKDGTLRICSRFEKGPIPGMTYTGYSFCTGEGSVGIFLTAERVKVTAYISGEPFEGRESIEIRKDNLIYVDGVDRTPAHLRVDPSKALTHSDEEVAKSSAPTPKQEEAKPSKAPAGNTACILRSIPTPVQSSPPPVPTKKKPAQNSSTPSPEQNARDNEKWMASMKALIARAPNVSDVSIGTANGTVNLSNVGTLTTEDILKIQRSHQQHGPR
jgi:hypothetical protein